MIFKEVVSLILKQNPSFVWEKHLKQVPLSLGLSNLFTYEVLNFNAFRERIKEKCPDEHSQLVLQPVKLALAYKAFFTSNIIRLLPCDNS